MTDWGKKIGNTASSQSVTKNVALLLLCNKCYTHPDS